jgi:anti-sigma factor RsiW
MTDDSCQTPTMTLEDPTLLDAYLDGELDPAHRLAVELALEADPRLAGQLQELARVRQLVGDLARPTSPYDWSAPVLARLAADPPAWYRWLAWKRLVTPRLLALSTGLAAAASLLVSVHFNGWPIDSAPKHTPTLVRPRSRPPESKVPPLAAAKPTVPMVVANVPTPTTPRNVPARPVADPDADRAAREDGRIRALLARADVRRIFVTTDTLDDGSVRRVDDALHRSYRKDPVCGRITLAQGIIVDPKRPGEAVVFAVVADGEELQRLRGNLEDAFPDGVDEESGPAPAEVLAFLTDAGQVSITGGKPPIARILPDDLEPHHHALRQDAPGFVADPPDRFRGQRAGPPTVRTSPHPGRRIAKDRPNRPRLRPDEFQPPVGPTTYLVWVSTPHRTAPGRR